SVGQRVGALNPWCSAAPRPLLRLNPVATSPGWKQFAVTPVPSRRRASSVADAAACGARTGKRGNRRVVGEAPPHFILSQQRDAEIAANSESLAVGTQAHGRTIDRAVARIENRAVLVGEPVSAHAFDESQSEHRRVLLFALALGAAPLLWVFTARLRKNLDDLSFKLALALRDPKPSLGLAGIAELFPQPARRRLLRPRRLRREARRRAQGHAKDEPEPLSHQ